MASEGVRRAITITVSLQTGPVITLLFGVGKRLGSGAVSLMIAGFLAVLTLGDIALVVGEQLSEQLQLMKSGAVAVVPAILTILCVALVFCSGHVAGFRQ